MADPTLRHSCLMCGGSCQGTYIPVLSEEEHARIERAAAELGVAAPVVEGRLRLESGACVFLGPDGLCSIHRALGFAAKPTVCKQYPLVALRAEQELRVGVDPGCYTAIRTWRTGPPVPEQSLTASKVPLEANEAAQEASLLALVGQPGQTLSGIAAGLLGPQAAPGLAGRIVTRLQAADLDALLIRPGTAPALVSALGPLAKEVPRWSAAAPPPWPVLGEVEEAWAVEVVWRMLFLRLAPTLPSPATSALLTVVGAVASAWTASDPDAFGAALSGWVRAIRAPMVWSAIVPDSAALAWLATGR